MIAKLAAKITEAKDAAIAVLLHNARGPVHGLPRTAGWGYPEPYTRDLMIAALGILVSRHPKLVVSLRRVLESLAVHQTTHGHIASLAHASQDVGASDTTPLFLLGLALYRQVTGEHDFLEEAAQKAMTWMDYQSPGDEVIIAQLPTSDWRDEQWVLGYGLFVNAVTYSYLRFFGKHEQAEDLRRMVDLSVVKKPRKRRRFWHGLLVPHEPYYALWTYKVYSNNRFDLLGNSLAILAGIPSPYRARSIVNWVEGECKRMRRTGELAVDLPPNFFPYIQPDDTDWLPRYAEFNRPGEYHNGGIWPFVCGFYVVAVLAAGYPRLAEKKLAALTELIRPARDGDLEFGFNEWHRAQDGTPQGNDWQTWSAAMYLYAAECVEQKKVLFFEEIR